MSAHARLDGAAETDRGDLRIIVRPVLRLGLTLCRIPARRDSILNGVTTRRRPPASANAGLRCTIPSGKTASLGGARIVVISVLRDGVCAWCARLAVAQGKSLPPALEYTRQRASIEPAFAIEHRPSRAGCSIQESLQTISRSEMTTLR
jgi:hypothetical protein